MAKPEVTEEMVTAAIRVLRKESWMPWTADVRDFTAEDVKSGRLRKANDAAEEQNRDLVRRALEVALATKQ